ncbi:sulfotransferase family 2 domain-containing protein [Planctobacterium marinum]|uniref:Sulfotransferase family protein n=1 Tax=Planctobacterium marinum TaxID=1631968 RepID=A0AA48HJ24_9ALTE|nr:hypothetical protein MACH26_00280 [Planctobacterium marinum]
MLISDSHRFIFVHVRKSGGTSIRDSVEKLSNPINKSLGAKVKSRFLKLERDHRKYAYRFHEDINTVKQLMPDETFKSYFKFAFVRNPWSRLASEYEYIRRTPEHGRHAKLKQMEFSDFIKYQSRRKDAHQINMLTDKNGNLQLDFVGKFENLANDWKTVTDQLGIENIALPHRNNAGIKNYDSYYTPETEKLVTRLWQRDIETFDYV